jgi:hypothetical protein
VQRKTENPKATKPSAPPTPAPIFAPVVIPLDAAAAATTVPVAVTDEVDVTLSLAIWL